MIEYKVIISPYFKREFYKLPKEIQEIARKDLYKLQYKLIGEPLKYELKGFYSIHFFRNKYRIIYSKEDNVLKNIQEKSVNFPTLQQRILSTV